MTTLKIERILQSRKCCNDMCCKVSIPFPLHCFENCKTETFFSYKCNIRFFLNKSLQWDMHLARNRWQHVFQMRSAQWNVLYEENCQILSFSCDNWGLRCRDRMVVGFTTIYEISGYQHKSVEFEFCTWRGVLKSTLCHTIYQWLAPGRWFPPPMKLTATI